MHWLLFIFGFYYGFSSHGFEDHLESSYHVAIYPFMRSNFESYASENNKQESVTEQVSGPGLSLNTYTLDGLLLFYILAAS